MGTRSLTHIKQDGKTLLTIYRQFDGYPEGMGKDLASFLAPITVVNGFGSNPVNQANGMGCLAAQLIKHLKDGIGNVYIYPANSKDCGEEYVYTISLSKSGKLNLRCREAYAEKKLRYRGEPKTVLAAIERDEKKVRRWKHLSQF